MNREEIKKLALELAGSDKTEDPEEKSVKYVCEICGYEYDEAEGDFENLPEDWSCPLCGVGKENFNKE